MSAPQLSWIDTLDDVGREAVLGLLAAAAAADGVEAVGEQVLLSLGRAGADGSDPHLLATVDGAVHGYAHLQPGSADEPAFVELGVHPEHRRAGTGTALLEQALARGGATTRVWAHGDGDPARALAVRAGLVGVRELWQMRLDLGAADVPGLPARRDVTVRSYSGPGDDAAVLAVNNAAFSWHPEQGGWGQDELDERYAEGWFDPAGLFLAHDAATGELLGFHWTKVHPAAGQDPAIGEVYVVAISPAAQGRGLGRLLTLTGLLHLRAVGLSTVLLYVEGDNAAAVHTYRRLGFTVVHTDRAYARP